MRPRAQLFGQGPQRRLTRARQRNLRTCRVQRQRQIVAGLMVVGVGFRPGQQIGDGARILGLPINIMPLLMGATMVIQMRLTPTPTADNAQMMMMKFMPIVFTLFCYNFAAALALYSTVNGVFTILQQVLVNKFTADTPVVTPAIAAKPTAKRPKARGRK